MKNVMVDLETLGTTADAVILSIGAVRFELESDAIDDNGFYASVSIDSNLLADRKINEATLLWWFKQPPSAQQVFFEDKQPLDAALQSLDEWIGADAPDIHVWSNGADFDIPMLAHAYAQYGWDMPWLFYNSRCVRTYKNLPGAKNIKRPNVGVQHNALDDAIAQVRHVQAIYQMLIGKKVTT